MDELEETLRRLRRDGTRTKLVHTISNFNNPMGFCFSLDRRKKLLRLAAEWGLIILDDDTYGDLRYDGENIPSLYGLDESGLVLKAKTFSKTIGPALRMGWVLGDRRALAALASVRRDLGMSQIIARALAEYMKAGKFEPHVARVSAIYRSKRDAMRAYLGEYCAPFIKWNNLAGGFYLWLELSPQVDPVKLTQLAAAKGVYCRPGQSTFPRRSRQAEPARRLQLGADERHRAGYQTVGRGAGRFRKLGVVSEARAHYW